MQNFDLLRIDGHTLRVFVSVCQTGSVSRTAALFELNQSTISHTLDKMRAALGDPLFVKTGRNISPNEKSLTLLPRVQNILADIEGLVTTENYDVALETKPLVIAIPTPALLNEIKGLRAQISQLAPRLTLDVRRLAPRSRLAEMLNQDEAELAITVAGLQFPSTLNHCVYGTEELVVFYDPTSRAPILTLEDYMEASHGVVNFGGGMKSEIGQFLADRGMERQVSLSAPTASMLGDLIHGTDLIATMPRRLADFSYRRLAHVPLPIPVPKIVYELVWHRRYEHSGRNMWLRNLILEARRPEDKHNTMAQPCA
ncbi:MAG: LysR family transcriptional regulator [Paracoccaceae bacterium]|nr:LysR family transcriptional regulator [Paracoccaceae bacterium]